MSHYKSKVDCGRFISAVNPQNPLWCHDEEVGYSGLLGDSIDGEVVGFSCFVGRFLQRDAETQTLSHQLHLMIPEPPLPPHTHTHTRSTAVTPFRDITVEHTQNNAHIHALTSNYPYIPHLMFLWNIAIIYIYLHLADWHHVLGQGLIKTLSHTIFSSPPYISRQIGIFKAVCTLWRAVVIFYTSLSLKWQPFWCF